MTLDVPVQPNKPVTPEFKVYIDPERPLEEQLKKIAFSALINKQTHHGVRWDYYEGRHTIKWSSDKLRDVFKSLHPKFIENWCSVVVDAVLDRLTLAGISVQENDQAEDLVLKWFEQEQIFIDSEEVHKEILVTGESYLIIWPKDATSSLRPDNLGLYWNDSRRVHLFYEPDNPKEKWFGAKWWMGADGKQYLTVMQRDTVSVYQATHDPRNMTGPEALTEASFILQEEFVNPFQEVGIPIFQFRRDLREGTELDNAMPIQDMLNKTVSDMMVSGEFGAFNQRWAVTNAEFPGGRVPFAPFTTTKFPASDKDNESTQVGQWDATELGNFVGAIDHFMQAMAVITGTPKHYFWGQQGSPSGEALIAMEAPLNKKVSKRVSRVKSTWTEIADFFFRVQRISGVERSQINSLYEDTRTVQPKSLAEVRRTNKEAGMPLITQLRDEGWNDADINQMLEDVALEVQLSGVNIAPTAKEQSAKPIQQQATENQAMIDQLAQKVSPQIQDLLMLLEKNVITQLSKSGALEKVLGNGR